MGFIIINLYNNLVTGFMANVHSFHDLFEVHSGAEGCRASD